MILRTYLEELAIFLSFLPTAGVLYRCDTAVKRGGKLPNLVVLGAPAAGAAS